MVWSSDITDLEVLHLLAVDPQQAYTLLLQHYGGRIRGYLRHRFPSLDATELQDVMTDALLALETTFDADRGTLAAWFLLLAHQHAVRVLRRRRGGLALLDEVAQASLVAGEDPVAALVSRERVEQLRQAISELPTLERAVVQSDLDGEPNLTAQALAEQLGTTAASVYTARKRARRRLVQKCRWIEEYLRAKDLDP